MFHVLNRHNYEDVGAGHDLLFELFEDDEAEHETQHNRNNQVSRINDQVVLSKLIEVSESIIRDEIV